MPVGHGAWLISVCSTGVQKMLGVPAKCGMNLHGVAQTLLCKFSSHLGNTSQDIALTEHSKDSSGVKRLGESQDKTDALEMLASALKGSLACCEMPKAVLLDPFALASMCKGVIIL